MGVGRDGSCKIFLFGLDKRKLAPSEPTYLCHLYITNGNFKTCTITKLPIINRESDMYQVLWSICAHKPRRLHSSLKFLSLVGVRNKEVGATVVQHERNTSTPQLSSIRQTNRVPGTGRERSVDWNLPCHFFRSGRVNIHSHAAVSAVRWRRSCTPAGACTNILQFLFIWIFTATTLETSRGLLGGTRFRGKRSSSRLLLTEG